MRLWPGKLGGPIDQPVEFTVLQYVLHAVDPV